MKNEKELNFPELKIPKKEKITSENVCEIINKYANGQKQLIVNKKIAKLLNKLAKRKHSKKNKVQNSNHLVEVKNVTKYYVNGEVINKVLDDVSLTIEKGEIILIFGTSGSGKSTLLNLISGLDRPNKGEIYVNNESLVNLDDRGLTKFRRNNVSFIFQSYNLLTNLSAYDNALTGAYLQKDKQKVLNIDELFKTFELSNEKNKYPSQLSGGQQQRVSIIRALAKNSEIIFADEPTGALDHATTKIVLKTLFELNKKEKTTIIFVSHDPQITPIADRVFYVKNGKIEKIVVNEEKKHPDEFLKID
ncbi:ABC transporter ATP-binding protein [Mycoplasmopsis gallinarum]|uniref:ABC transporter ATP-binding protein n=1 Tax=Mycoplasmopsis gallinarum TaxID=29557 RepID=A0A168RAN7_9BACT|nr:ABC transporter ATP-binding protein [Mycoplasmopsis gallinarum]OAB48786.1 ABC transporter ATP-binding protein [Mycoplasmopsis gallinarum]